MIGRALLTLLEWAAAGLAALWLTLAWTHGDLSWLVAAALTGGGAVNLRWLALGAAAERGAAQARRLL